MMMRGIGRALLVAALLCLPPVRAAGPADAEVGEAVPKVLYIVPWKQMEPRRTQVEPPVTRVEHAPEPLDRDTFRRELRLRRQLERRG